MASTMLSYQLRAASFFTLSNRLNCSFSCAIFSRSQSSSTQVGDESEYSETPEYPPLFENTLYGRARRRRQEEYDFIKSLPTVEEKLLHFSADKEGKQNNLKRLVRIQAIDTHYELLPFKLFATRTSLKEGLPDVYGRMNVDALAEHIKPIVLNTILDTFSGIKVREPLEHVEEKLSDVLRCRDQLRGQMMTDQILRAVTTVLSSQLPHLRDCQFSYHPQVSAFWLAGGFAPHEGLKRQRKRNKYGLMTPVDAPVDARLQYTGKPYIQLRHTQPLPPFLDLDDPLCTNYDVPEYKYETKCARLTHQVRCPKNLPGFWLGDPYGFGSLTVYTTESLRNYTERFGEDSLQDALHSCGVMSSFGWLVSLAHFKGFTVHQELTYPLTTQTVLTNGKHWSFYAYQLNKMCLHADLYTKQHQNICWTTGDMKLFDAVENGNVVGYNDEVVKLLIKYLAYAPKEREGVNLTPYLKPADNTGVEEEWLEINRKLKLYYANRKLHLPYGHRQWEMIYKVKFNTRLE